MTHTEPRSSEDHADIRAAVRSLCAGFAGDYWRRLDRERAYPADFVAALTKAGFLAALIPEQWCLAQHTLSLTNSALAELISGVQKWAHSR